MRPKVAGDALVCCAGVVCGTGLYGGGNKMVMNRKRKTLPCRWRLHTLLLPPGARAKERNKECAGTHLTHSTTLTTTAHSLCTHLVEPHSFAAQGRNPAFQIQLWQVEGPGHWLTETSTRPPCTKWFAGSAALRSVDRVACRRHPCRGAFDHHECSP